MARFLDVFVLILRTQRAWVLSAIFLNSLLAAGQSHKPAVGSNPPKTIERNPVAMAMIAKALTAMGLPSGPGQIETVRLTGTVEAPPGRKASSGSFTVLVRVADSGYEVRNDFTDGKRATIYVSGHGSAYYMVGQLSRRMSGHVNLINGPARMPMLELIRAFNRPNYQVEMADAERVETVLASHIRIGDETDHVTHMVTQQDWYFDSASGLPLRWVFSVPNAFDAERSIGEGMKDFANYGSLGGLNLPTLVRYSWAGRPTTVTHYSTVELNVAVSPSDFDGPSGEKR